MEAPILVRGIPNMSDISDFGSDLGKRLRARDEESKIADQVRLRRDYLINVKIADFGNQFISSVKEGLDAFNHESGNCALLKKESDGSVHVAFRDQEIFHGKVDEGMATKISFIGGWTSHSYLVSLNQDNELVVIDHRKFPLSTPQALAKRALELMLSSHIR
jgi:hypothetical protein